MIKRENKSVVSSTRVPSGCVLLAGNGLVEANWSHIEMYIT